MLVTIQVLALSILASMLFTALCFMGCVFMCYLSRSVQDRRVARQMGELKGLMGVTISQVGRDVNAGDIAGRDKVGKT